MTYYIAKNMSMQLKKTKNMSKKDKDLTIMS
nr:MAG TPA: hypothetical protein [Caudoviricetes sp.]